jgi:hypothetical protein
MITWGLTIRTSAEYEALVILIRLYGWPCCAALQEEDAFDSAVPHVFWEPSKDKLWRGRFTGLDQVSLAELPARMEVIIGAR